MGNPRNFTQSFLMRPNLPLQECKHPDCTVMFWPVNPKHKVCDQHSEWLKRERFKANNAKRKPRKAALLLVAVLFSALEGKAQTQLDQRQIAGSRDAGFSLVNSPPSALILNANASTKNPAIAAGSLASYKFTVPSTIVVSPPADPAIAPDKGEARICFDPSTGMLNVFHDMASTITATGDLFQHVFAGTSCPYPQATLWLATITTPLQWDTIDETMDWRPQVSFSVPPTAPAQ